ncbi:MAG: NAD(P)-dependent oxidoreductase [Acidobacteria bacterium]|nr:NAD(P)-dependent oxidoreductase [Acidobacteriota bacterium]
MERVLVTGAAGYVGREVVRRLLASGKKVTGLARNRANPECDSIRADLADAPSLARALANRAFDSILHLASLPGDTGDPQQMVAVNVTGFLNLLEYARRAGAGRVVLASSISAYGWYPGTRFDPPDFLPVREEHPCRPKDIYSTSKRAQELLAMTYQHQYGVPASVLRLTAVVGPRGSGGGRGWRDFAQQLAAGRRVQIPHFSAEEQCHYVDYRDVARMFLTAAEHPGAAGEIFNCAGPAPVRGAQFVEIVRALAPGIEIDFGFPWSMAQGHEISFDMSKARRLLGFEPVYSLADSIASILAWTEGGGLAEQTQDLAYQTGVAQTT